MHGGSDSDRRSYGWADRGTVMHKSNGQCAMDPVPAWDRSDRWMGWVGRVSQGGLIGGIVRMTRYMQFSSYQIDCDSNKREYIYIYICVSKP